MTPASVTILLSTYNGSRFLAEQIESIRRQSFTNWNLLVRDDGSSDETVWVVESMAAADRRVALLKDRRGNLGPTGSFGVLLEHVLESGAGYVALADQDDIWELNKLARQVDLLEREEREVGETTPLLVHSDLAVVREDLSLVHPSFFAFQGLRRPADWPLGRLLIQNVVTGCTTLFNRALLRVAVPVPPVIMHDWWLALCAVASGRVVYLPEPTVRYRQHGQNAQGSRGWRSAVIKALRRPRSWWQQSGELFQRTVEQARELTERLECAAPANPAVSRSLPALREFSTAFGGRSAMDRLRAVYRHGFRPHSFLPYPVAFYVRVALWTRPPGPASAAYRPEQVDRTKKRRAPAST
ncbi:MAG: glycosyltransferase family 2 protein [Gemmatimonadales bacterium]